MIDDQGENLGEIDTDKAIFMAREKELDLVAVAPESNPPVAKILSWSKFKYQQKKKRKESKSKRVEQKEMWFKAFIDSGDMQHKIKKVKEFLDKKHPVKLTIKAKGRVTREHMNNLIDNILSELEGYVEYDGRPKSEGRNMALIVRPTKKIKPEEKNNEKK